MIEHKEFSLCCCLVVLILSRAFIASPRRSASVPNSTGTYAIYTISKYSFDSHSETNEVRILDLKTGQSTLFSDDASNSGTNWLVDNQVIWTKKADGGVTEVWIGTAGGEDKG